MRRLLLPIALLAAAAAAPATAQTADSLRVWDTRASRERPFAQLADSLARYDVVFVGEQHDDPATHRTELALLHAIGSRRGRVMLALEMFERDAQPLLDDYGIGRIDEAAFLRDSRPWPNYAADYRPLVEYARARRWPVVASNVPRPLASAVSRGGLGALDTLPAARGHLYADDLQCAPEGPYFRRFGEAMGGMGGHGGADTASARASLERFYAAQCIKDETMAESIDRARQAWPGWMVVHYNGAFHSDERLGTAERVARRVPSARIAVVSVVPVPDPATADAASFADRGDFVILVRAPAGAAQ